MEYEDKKTVLAQEEIVMLDPNENKDMGHGRSKSTGLGVIKWTIKAILCSTALIALVIGYSIIGAFLFREVENRFSIQNAHESQQDRADYLKNVTGLLQSLCQELSDEKRKAIETQITENADNTNDNSTVVAANATALNSTDANSTDVVTQAPEVANISLPELCANRTMRLVMEQTLRAYEDNLKYQRGWRFDFRDDDMKGPRWSLAQGLLFSVTVITTIGYGNLVPKTLLGRIATMIYAMLGIPLMLLCLAYIGNIWANVLRLIYTAFYRCCQKCRKANKRKTGKMDVTSKKGEKNNDKSKQAEAKNGAASSMDPELAAAAQQEHLDEEDEMIPVPAWLAFLILVSYIGGGSVLFSQWEGWPYKDSIYFCFITFSTIGFGDLVPGDSIDENDPQRAATCAIYILFGLATMSMVISVIQEDVIRVVYKLGNKIGLVKQKKPSG